MTTNPVLDLSRIDGGEALWLWRSMAGLTQARAAVILGIGRTALSAAENAANPRVPPPTRNAVKPSRRFLLVLARRRSRLGLRYVAEAVGVSRVTILIWERRDDPRLVAFWTRRGFIFP